LNTAQNTRLTAIETLNTTQDTRLTGIDTLNTTQDTRLTGIDTLNTTQNTRLTAVETLNTTQDTRLTGIDTLNTAQNTRLTAIETLNTTQDTRLTGIDTLNTTQNTRLTAVETLNTTQDTRLTAVETLNTTQNIRLTAVETVNTTQGTSITTLQGKTVQINYVTPVPAIGPMTQITSSLDLLPYTSATILKAYTLSCNAVTCLGQIVAGGVGIVTSQIQVTNSGSIIKGLLIGTSVSVVGPNTVTFSTAFTGTLPKVLISSNNGTNLSTRTLTNFTYSCSVAGLSIDWIAIQ
jgi:hypothetical protein